MSPSPQIALEPRKSPIQARSMASVDAILEATIQVLLDIGKDRLTTTRVAHRAGVSVGTLYQYFPNKSSLLQAALRRHLDEVAETVHRVSYEQCGQPLTAMVTALITDFLSAKMRDPRSSVALYTVSVDLDAASIVRENAVRFHTAITGMLASSSEPLATDPGLVASILQGAMVGISRRILESPEPEEQLRVLQPELIHMACTYVLASAAVCSKGKAPAA